MRSSFFGLGFGLLGAIVAHLFVDRGQLPVLARSLHHYYGLAGALAESAVSADYAHHAQCSVADGRSCAWRGDGEFDSAGFIFPRPNECRGTGAGSGDRSGLHAHAPVIMTALAMIIGMVRWRWVSARAASRMLRWRAVIGGLLFATVATYFSCPAYLR